MGILQVSGGLDDGYTAEVSAEDHAKVGLNVKAPWNADFGVKIKMTRGEARVLAYDLLAYADGDGRS
jgi:hypothetical protein